MHQIRNWGLLAFCVFAFVGCDTPNDITGALSLTSAVTLNRTGNQKPVTLQAGNYRGKVHMGSNGGTLTLQTSTGSVGIFVPALVADQSGRIQVSAKTLGQSFGLSGQISDSQVSFDENVNERCYWGTQPVYGCGPGGRNCGWHEEQIWGWQQTEEQGYNEMKNVVLNLVGSKKLGTFSASYKMQRVVQQATPLEACVPDMNSSF